LPASLHELVLLFGLCGGMVGPVNMVSLASRSSLSGSEDVPARIITGGRHDSIRHGACAVCRMLSLPLMMQGSLRRPSCCKQAIFHCHLLMYVGFSHRSRFWIDIWLMGRFSSLSKI